MICGRYERKNQFAVFGLYRDDTRDAPLANEWSVDRKHAALTIVNERVKAARQAGGAVKTVPVWV